MNEQPITTPMPTPSDPIVVDAPQTPTPAKPSLLHTWAPYITIVVVLGILAIGFFAFRSQQSGGPVASVTPTPRATAISPTPIRSFSPIATQSAFLEARSMVASLSAAIAATNVLDQSLTPPTIELPLGFTK